MSIDPTQAKAIFLEALDKHGPERAAYLDTSCGTDSAARHRIEAMLRAHEASGELLDRAPAAMLADARTAAAGNASRDEETLSFLAPPSREETLGRLGHYHVQQVVGRGGFGIVLKAFDEKLHRIVAIKVLAPELAVSASARQRFIREARAAAAIAHEHVVAIHAIEEEERPPFIVMQYVDGVSLQDKLDRKGPLELREVLRIGTQIAAGLAVAHKHGLVHRDIKPANILLENGVERVKITDFGLARTADDGSRSQSGIVAGTPLYMSPEQASGAAVDHRSDLFSLGSVLYAMCTGRPPFRASSTMAVLKRVCEETPTPVQEVNAAVPDWLAGIIARLHAKDPAERFQSAGELADLLAQWLARLQQPTGASAPQAPGHDAKLWPSEADVQRANEILAPTVGPGLARLWQSTWIAGTIGAIGAVVGIGLGMTNPDLLPWHVDENLVLLGLLQGAVLGAVLGIVGGVAFWVVDLRKAWEKRNGLRSPAGVRNDRPAMTPGARRFAWTLLLPIAAGLFVVVLVIVVRVRRDRIEFPKSFVPAGENVIDGRGVSWGTVVDPNGDCTCESAPDGMAIGVPPGDHDLSIARQSFAAPRVMQRVKGDFNITVQVLPFPRPKHGRKAADAKTAHVSAGLLCWQDSGSFLRLARADDHVTSATVELDVAWGGHGGVTTSRGQVNRDAAVSLRIERRDGDFRCWYCPDGMTWSEFPIPGGPGQQWFANSPMNVGVTATNTTGGTHVARFRDLEFKLLQ
jgi:serine/threonine protein kinase